jgi:hypothetical protein
MTEKDTITVIITSYNRGEIIGRAVDSVLGQTRSADEIILVDMKSSSLMMDLLTTPINLLKKNILILNISGKRIVGSVMPVIQVFLRQGVSGLPFSIQTMSGFHLSSKTSSKPYSISLIIKYVIPTKSG